MSTSSERGVSGEGAGLRSALFRLLVPRTSALAFLPLLATTLAALLLARSTASDEAAQRLRSDAALVRETCRAIAGPGDGAPLDARALDALAKRLGQELETRFTVIDGRGVVLADSDHDPSTMDNHANRPEVLAARERGAGQSTRLSTTFGEPFLYVALRLDDAHPDRGVVRASLPVARVESRSRATLVQIAWVAAPLAAIASLLLVTTLLGITGAIGEVSRVARAVTSGRPLEPMDAVDRRDEIGDLARSVQAMASELGTRIETIGRERNELRTIVSSVAEGLLAVDSAGRFLFSNEAALRLLDVRSEPRPGADLVDAVPHGGVVSLAREALTRREVVARTVEVFRAEGPPREVEVRATPLEGGQGLVLVIRDVTEAARYERLRREFVANASHELRTPLSLVKGCLETLEDGALRDPEKGPRFVQIASRHVDSLAALVEDLLTLGRLDAAVDTRPPQPVELAPVVEGVLAGFELAVERKKLRLERALAPDLPPALGHGDLLERAVRNLVDNAVKYTDQGWVKVAVRGEGAELVVEVSDSGPGIPREDLGRIFERFYRVEKSRTREAGGTGLGLAIVKHIAQQEHGTVTVESEVGKGTVFRFAVPAAQPTDSGLGKL